MKRTAADIINEIIGQTQAPRSSATTNMVQQILSSQIPQVTSPTITEIFNESVEDVVDPSKGISDLIAKYSKPMPPARMHEVIYSSSKNTTSWSKTEWSEKGFYNQDGVKVITDHCTNTTGGGSEHNDDHI